MFKAKIITGCWDEQSIELSGMPKDFILSARELVVSEINEYDTLKAKADLHDELVEALGDMNSAVAHVIETGRITNEDIKNFNKAFGTLAKAKEIK